MRVSRRFKTFLARGTKSNPTAGDDIEAGTDDALAKMILDIGDGQLSFQEILLASGGGSHSVELPSDYVNTKRYQVIMITNRDIKVTNTSPDHSSSNVVVKGSPTHPGFMIYDETVTAITLTNDGASDALVKYMVYEKPDPSQDDTFVGGKFTTGAR